MAHLLAAIEFDNEIRGIFIIVASVLVWFGSIYAIIATNVGARLGFVISLSSLFGWCFLMGLIWWMYSLGFHGRDPSWIGKEVNFSRASPVATQVVQNLPSPDDLPDPKALLEEYPEIQATAEEDVAFKTLVDEYEDNHRLTLSAVVTTDSEIRKAVNDELGGWRILAETDPRRGETVASAETILISNSAKSVTTFETAADYYVQDVFFYGGKDAAEPYAADETATLLTKAWNRVKSTVEVKNPELYAVVTLRQAKEFQTTPGATPEPPQPNEEAEYISVVMLRDLGNRRFVPFVFSLLNLIGFIGTVMLLQSRDGRVKELHAQSA